MEVCLVEAWVAVAHGWRLGFDSGWVVGGRVWLVMECYFSRLVLRQIRDGGVRRTNVLALGSLVSSMADAP